MSVAPNRSTPPNHITGERPDFIGKTKGILPTRICFSFCAILTLQAMDYIRIDLLLLSNNLIKSFNNL